MARDASITLDWGDDTYTFRLAWGELAKLQEVCDAGPYVILSRLSSNSWRMEDISSVIRFGLIGGGKTPVEALKLVRSYVEDRPPVENLLVAQAILSAGLIGAPDEEQEPKKENRQTESTSSQMERSGLPNSTESEPS